MNTEMLEHYKAIKTLQEALRQHFDSTKALELLALRQTPLNKNKNTNAALQEATEYFLINDMFERPQADKLGFITQHLKDQVLDYLIDARIEEKQYQQYFQYYLNNFNLQEVSTEKLSKAASIFVVSNPLWETIQKEYNGNCKFQIKEGLHFRFQTGQSLFSFLGREYSFSSTKGQGFDIYADRFPLALYCLQTSGLSLEQSIKFISPFNTSHFETNTITLSSKQIRDAVQHNSQHYTDYKENMFNVVFIPLEKHVLEQDLHTESGLLVNLTREKIKAFKV